MKKRIRSKNDNFLRKLLHDNFAPLIVVLSIVGSLAAILLLTLVTKTEPNDVQIIDTVINNLTSILSQVFSGSAVFAGGFLLGKHKGKSNDES